MRSDINLDRKILNNKIYLYMTEFFAGMSVMAVELGAKVVAISGPDGVCEIPIYYCFDICTVNI